MSLIVRIKKDFGAFKLDVDFTAENGVTSLLGASGCGKSMTLKCIAGIEKPDEGHIELDGTVLYDSERHINLPPQKRRVGYLFQNYALFPNMTVRQNILCGLNREKDKSVKEQRIKEMLRLMQLEGLENHKPAQLSGGQQQRTALARILVSDPRLLLLDEPFSALDGHLRDSLKIELRDLLQRFRHEVLMVTHDRGEAYNMSSSIAVMDRGRLLCIKPTKELFADPGSVQASILTGCKNNIPARRVDAHTVEVPDWGVTLETKQEVRQGLRAIGIRAHYFSPDARQNRFPVRFVEEMEEPFEFILQFRYAGV
jgi:molybdate transport system ATP-binding protein